MVEFAASLSPASPLKALKLILWKCDKLFEVAHKNHE
jgi:hypothetical protein